MSRSLHKLTIPSFPAMNVLLRSFVHKTKYAGYQLSDDYNIIEKYKVVQGKIRVNIIFFFIDHMLFNAT